MSLSFFKIFNHTIVCFRSRNYLHPPGGQTKIILCTSEKFLSHKTKFYTKKYVHVFYRGRYSVWRYSEADDRMNVLISRFRYSFINQMIATHFYIVSDILTLIYNFILSSIRIWQRRMIGVNKGGTLGFS